MVEADSDRQKIQYEQINKELLKLIYYHTCRLTAVMHLISHFFRASMKPATKSPRIGNS